MPAIVTGSSTAPGSLARSVVADRFRFGTTLHQQKKAHGTANEAAANPHEAEVWRGMLQDGEGFLHDVRGGQAFLDQDLAETAKKRCDDHAMLA